MSKLKEILEDFVDNIEQENYAHQGWGKEIDSVRQAILSWIKEEIESKKILDYRYDKGSNSQNWKEGYNQAITDMVKRLEE